MGRDAWCYGMVLGTGVMVGLVAGRAIGEAAAYGLGFLLTIVSAIAVTRIDDRRWRDDHGTGG